MRFKVAHAFLINLCIISFAWVNCWEDFELDLFDLVEDVNENFYDVFDVKQECEYNDIRRAYRKLSLKWHPDKNKDPGAEKKFRQIAAIYEVLKDEKKRKRYDDILEFGLPDWRTPVYYFRKARKLGFLDLVIIFSVVVSIGHYFVMWAQYFEHKLTIADRMSDVKKKLEREKKRGKKAKGAFDYEELDEELQEYYDSIPTPSIKNALPCKLFKLLIYTIKNFPSIAKNGVVLTKDGVIFLAGFIRAKLAKKEKKNSPKKDGLNKSPSSASLASSRTPPPSPQQSKRESPKKVEPTSSDTLKPVITYELKKKHQPKSESTQEEISTNKEWSDKEKADLIKAIAKYPAGSTSRWSNIAAFVGRSEQDCIKMEKSMKTNLTSSTHSSLNATSWLQKINFINPKIKEEPTIRVDETMTTENNNLLIDSKWTQESQSLFEKALKDYPKDYPNRWDKIASCVPNKTKEECIERFKVLCEALKKKQ